MFVGIIVALCCLNPVPLFPRLGRYEGWYIEYNLTYKLSASFQSYCVLESCLRAVASMYDVSILACKLAV